MQIGHSERIKFSDEQKAKLRQWLGSSRSIWNSKIEENNYYYTFAKKFTPINQWQWINKQEPEHQWVNQQYSHFKDKKLSPWLSETPSPILRNSASKWFQTQMNFMKGECGPPRKKSRTEGSSMLLTKDAFEILDFDSRKMTLLIGQERNNIGVITVKFRRNIVSPPNSITIKVDSYDRWRISFSYDDRSDKEKSNSETDLSQEWFAHLKTKSESDISELVLGLDRGVVIPIATLDANYDFDHKQKESLVSKDKYIKRMQRKIARQKKGSRKRAKTKQRIARLHEQRANIRRDFAHKATRKIVDTENKSVFVLENLGTKRMTASAAGTVDEPGKNVAQKSGLNKEILNIGWNQIAVFLTYKAMRAGKVVFKVSPNHTSQECSHCGYTHQDNRPEQELFVCGKCGHTENADKNAARVIGKRAIKLILDSGTELSSKGVLTPKKIKTGRRKAKFSAEAGTTQ